jgi:hypothetical protein
MARLGRETRGAKRECEHFLTTGKCAEIVLVPGKMEEDKYR